MESVKRLKLLLDTHIWLWSVLEPALLAKHTTEALLDTKNEIWISPISTWEIMILCQKKRLNLNTDPEKWIEAVLSQVPFKEAPLTHEVAIVSATIGVPHADPADRFLAASAKVYSLTLVTNDQNLMRGHGYKVLPNR
jgi:PIN domain nuclease of toxin-antitoxin system